MEIGDIVKTCNLKAIAYNGRRAKIIKELNENGRYGVKVLFEDNVTRDILVIPQNLLKLPDERHFGSWGCSDCGGSCNCVRSEFGHHSGECNHYMNTLRRKGPLCNGAAKCYWVGCCLGESINGPCKVLDRGTRQIPTFKYPEREWVVKPDGSKSLEPKAWPYM